MDVYQFDKMFCLSNVFIQCYIDEQVFNEKKLICILQLKIIKYEISGIKYKNKQIINKMYLS